MIKKELLKKYGEWRRLTEEDMEGRGGATGANIKYIAEFKEV